MEDTYPIWKHTDRRYSSHFLKDRTYFLSLDDIIKRILSDAFPVHYKLEQLYRSKLGVHANIGNLIPKPTSLVAALRKVLPNCKNNFYAMSVRVPTSIVSASDMVLSLEKQISPKLIIDVLGELEHKYPDVIKLNRESLVSIDYKGLKQSCIIDLQWLEIINNKLKLILWYDNEWGYSNRVIDLVKLISNK